MVQLSDLEEHETLRMPPLKVEYKDVTVWEIPPPTHGLAALIALGYSHDQFTNNTMSSVLLVYICIYV